MMEPEPGMLIAFNAAPGTVAPATTGSYGPYAQAVAEMMREGGLPLAALFDRVRLRVNDVTRGGQVPWHASNVEAPFVFLERTADAPAPVVSDEQARQSARGQSTISIRKRLYRRPGTRHLARLFGFPGCLPG